MSANTLLVLAQAPAAPAAPGGGGGGMELINTLTRISQMRMSFEYNEVALERMDQGFSLCARQKIGRWQ
jgi:hypothetical protein